MIKKFIEIKCGYCENKTLKELKEYERQIGKGRVKFYCNLSCAAKDNVALVKQAEYSKTHPTEFNLKVRDIPRIRTNPPNPFKYYIRKIRQRLKGNLTQRNIEFNLSDSDLQKIWEKQKGICPYTQKDMCFPSIGQSGLPYQASLDRIDSSKGYTIENVEFVCLCVNYAKNGFSKEQMLAFFKGINEKEI